MIKGSWPVLHALRDVALFLLLVTGLAGSPAVAQMTPPQLVENLNRKTFTGRPVDLDFTDTDLREVLAHLHDASGVTFDLDPRVRERVTVHLQGVPWDEALDRLLSEHRLHAVAAHDGVKVVRSSRQVTLVFEDPKKAHLALLLYRLAVPILAVAAAGIGALILVRTIRKRRRRPGRPLLDEGRAEEVVRSVEQALGVDRVYRDCRLTLQSLARAIGVTPHQLSWIVNQRMQRSFNELLNGHRVAEVKRRLADPEEAASILQIAFDAGFGTKGAFNRVFKSSTGMTPSEFKRRATNAGAAAPGDPS